jgi:2-methylcitrate dehydratase PrpD
MKLLERLVGLGQLKVYPAEALEAARVVVVHDLAVAISATPVVGDLLDDLYGGASDATDIATGRRIDIPSAVSRNGQLLHALTQDDTLLPAMTHVGATTMPLLLAMGETQTASLQDFVAGLAAAFAAAEMLGEPVAAHLSARGVRPTPVIGPIAAVVGAARMQHWSEERLRRAVGRVAALAFGTIQPWVDGSQEWLFQISAAGLLALAAARSSAKPWAIAVDPLWGDAGLFRCLGVPSEALKMLREDHERAATRANVKRFPACAINQVPLVLLQEAMAATPIVAGTEITLHLSPAEARYPGITRTTGLTSWSARLMSLPYCVAVMSAKGGFRVDDVREWPAGISEDDLQRVRVVEKTSARIGQYTLEMGGARPREGSIDVIGKPSRDELRHAARTAVGADVVAEMLGLLDGPVSRTVSDLTSRLRHAQHGGPHAHR